jgi:chemotaxis protein MotB
LRAVSIVEYIIAAGITPQRLQAEGLSQYHPIASNATPEGRAANRRADIVILYP